MTTGAGRKGMMERYVRSRELCLTINFGPAVHGFRRSFHVTLDVHVEADRRGYQLIGHLDQRMD